MVGFRYSTQAHAGTCGQSASRRHSLRRCMVTRDAKCVCCISGALWSKHGPWYAVKDDPRRSDLTRSMTTGSSKPSNQRNVRHACDAEQLP